MGKISKVELSNGLKAEIEGKGSGAELSALQTEVSEHKADNTPHIGKVTPYSHLTDSQAHLEIITDLTLLNGFTYPFTGYELKLKKSRQNSPFIWVDSNRHSNRGNIVFEYSRGF